jgi:hypothetical protein
MFHISSSWILRKLRMTDTIDFFCKSPSTNHARICPESHIPSFCRESLLMLHDMDDIIFAFWGEFFARCIRDTEDITSEFDRHDLRTKAYSKVGDFLLSCVLCSHDHPFCSTSPESSRYTDTIESLEELHSLFLYIFSFYEAEFYTFLMSKCSTLKSLIE